MVKQKYTKLKIEQIDDHNCLVNDEFIKLRGMGGCRPKGFYKNVIIKFDDDQNDREIEIWRSLKKSDRKFFPKLLQYSKKDNFIIQERVSFSRGRKAAKHYDVVFDLITKYKIHDIGFNGINDNWSVRADNGIPCIYDYGCTYNFNTKTS